MNRFIAFLYMFLIALALLAQGSDKILVSYDYVYPNTHGKIRTLKMSLIASPSEARYYNETSLWVDSLKSTPEGKAKYMEIIKKACMTVGPDGVMNWDMRKGPTKKTHLYVFTELGEGKVAVYDKYGDEQGYYTEPIEEQAWIICGDSVKTVLGYDCVMAECDYHGRHWKAWFAPEIPMPFGPWKFRGLPGLVLKAEAEGGFGFEASGIENTDRTITPMYFRDDYPKVDRKKALNNAEYFKNNEESILNAQGQRVKIYTTDDNGNKIETPKYDGLKHSLEPDYKMK